jgi:hypothetical protein
MMPDHLLMVLFSECHGAPLLPLLYITLNMAFNISALNLVKMSTAVVASLTSTLAGYATVCSPSSYFNVEPKYWCKAIRKGYIHLLSSFKILKSRRLEVI